MDITEFNVTPKTIISAFDILKVAKRSELYFKEDAAGPCSPFLRCFHLSKVN